MTDLRDSVEQAALTWLVQVNDPGFDDWDGWERWLAESEDHQAAYWRLAEAEADIRETLVSAPPPTAKTANDDKVAPFRRPVKRRWFAAGLGVAAAATAAVWLGWPASQTWSVETRPGEQRSLTLADGSIVHLDGATRLTLDRRDTRALKLDAGRALFEVTHDPRRPFSVVVGEATVTDLGTVFDITRLTDGARIGVSEGVVRFDGSGRVETLRAGEGLTAIDGVVSRRLVGEAVVAGWREGRVTYEDERLAVIAQDLAREIGRPVAVAAPLAERRFTGSLNIRGSQPDLKARLELLLNVVVRVEGDTWRLQPRTGA